MKRWIKRLLIALALIALLGFGLIIGTYYHLKSDLPDVATIQDIKLQVPMKVFSLDGELLSQFGEKRRIPLKREEVPEQLINAFLATEDSRYYQHYGIDPIGIVRAATVYISSGHAKQGASTITQQVARNFFLTREKTFIRKIKEVFIAIQIEQLLTKDEILMLYLNKISLGHRSFGIGAAAQVYYGKTVDQLTLPEMAVLAGLPKAPSANNPIYSPSNAKARRNIVLMRMLAENHISQTEYNEAKEAPITGRHHGAEITLSAHYVADLAHKKILEMYGSERVYNNGYNVYTTINKNSQEAANQAVINNVYNYDQRHGYRGATDVFWEAPDDSWSTEMISKRLKEEPNFGDLQPAVVIEVNDKSIKVLSKGNEETEQEILWDGLKWARSYISDKRQGSAPKLASDIVAVGELIWVRKINDLLTLSQYPDVSAAFVSLNPQDGAITSMVGGFSFVQSKFNRVTQAERQVGSNIKPFIYSAALDHGYTLATLVNDAPITQWTGSATWRPKNSPNVYDGPIRLRRALGQSKNVVSVRLLQDVGIDSVINQLGKYGFDEDKIPKNNSIALGSASLSPLKLATGYAIIANGGYQVEPYIIERIEDAYGTVIYQATPKIVCEGCDDLYKQQAAGEKITNNFQQANSNLCAISPVSEEQVAQSVISTETAFLTRQLLYSAIWGGGSAKNKTNWNGTGWRAARGIQRKDMGGKTGTTNDSKDAWFSGFVGNVVATSWVGFDNFSRELGRATLNKNLGKEQVSGGEFGARTALPAWIEFMKNTEKSNPVIKQKRPNSISTARIDRKTGLLTRETDSTAFFEYFRSDSMPTKYVEPADAYGDSLFDGSTNTESNDTDDELF